MVPVALVTFCLVPLQYVLHVATLKEYFEISTVSECSNTRSLRSIMLCPSVPTALQTALVSSRLWSKIQGVGYHLQKLNGIELFA